MFSNAVFHIRSKVANNYILGKGSGKSLVFCQKLNWTGLIWTEIIWTVANQTETSFRLVSFGVIFIGLVYVQTGGGKSTFGGSGNFLAD